MKTQIVKAVAKTNVSLPQYNDYLDESVSENLEVKKNSEIIAGFIDEYESTHKFFNRMFKRKNTLVRMSNGLVVNLDSNKFKIY